MADLGSLRAAQARSREAEQMIDEARKLLGEEELSPDRGVALPIAGSHIRVLS